MSPWFKQSCGKYIHLYFSKK